MRRRIGRRRSRRKWRRRKIGARERKGAAGEAKLEEGGKEGKCRGYGL
jgi:hypothetical protein